MIYAIITLGSLTAVVVTNVYIKKKRQRFSLPWLLFELPLFWLFIFCIFYIGSYNNYGYWPGEDIDYSTVFKAVAIGIIISLAAILINIFFNQNKKEKYAAKCLFTFKGIDFFPLNSFIYTLTGLIIVVTGMFILEFIVNLGNDSDDWDADYVTTNNMNFEKLSSDLEYPLVKIKGTDFKNDSSIKILVLGDSFVFGFGSSNINYLWWNQLNGELTRRGYNCTVYAVGEGGASTYNELNWLTTTSMVSDLDPDIIIIGYVTNDAEYDPLSGGNYAYAGNYYGTISQVVDLPLKTALQKFLPTVYAGFDYAVTLKFSKLDLVRKKFGYQIADWEQVIVEGQMLSNYNSYIIDPLGKYAASTKIPIILVTTPQTPDLKYFEPKYSAVLPLFEKAGIKTYNMLYNFYSTCSDEKYADNFAMNPTDPHPGTASTWFYSKYIADKLEADYPDILGDKTLTGEEVYNIDINDWMPFSLSPQPVAVSATSAQYVISYPAQNSPGAFLKMPVKEEYIKLNFKYPVDLSTVSITGEKLGSAVLYVTGINEDLGFDDQILHGLGAKTGKSCDWTDNTARRVTSLCIHAETADGTGDNLTVKITCKEGAVTP